MPTETSTRTALIIEDIEGGSVDDDLDEIGQAVISRRHTVARMRFHQLQPGDTVRIVGRFRPRYLVGATAEVVEKRVTKVVIQFPDEMGDRDPYHKYAGKQWIFPVTVMEKVED
jgi:hypothetical protein